MDAARRKRLIEVAFPLEEVSEDARRDAYRGSPHPQTLHRWWARRPLSACRAFIYASLVDDPTTDAEREELLKEVADLANWNAIRHPEKIVRKRSEGGSGLTGTELLEQARCRILDCNDGKPPTLLDPFAGGGAIPLEGLRLGCEVEASDLNPVAVLILKGTIEYPQRYGQPNSRSVPDYIRQASANVDQNKLADEDLADAYQRNPLATDVRYWGNWMLNKAREELAEFYPPDPDGSVPVAYLWSQTIVCPNCVAEMPLIRQFWLARKGHRRVALEPVLEREHDRVDFRVVEGSEIVGNPSQATTSGGDTRCLLCEQVVKAKKVRELGIEGKLSSTLTSVVLSDMNRTGKRYREDIPVDWKVYKAAANKLRTLQEDHEGDLGLVPDEPIYQKTLGLRIDAFGLDHWVKIFNERQLLALATFSLCTQEAHAEMLKSGLDFEYATAVTTYLGLATSRLSGEHSTMTRWNPSGMKAQGAFGLQALSMVWDFAELNPWGGSVGDAKTAIRLATSVIAFASEIPVTTRVEVACRDVQEKSNQSFTAVITDPPYYNAIDYAGLSDFYYVWMKRSVGPFHPDLLTMPLTPKKQQAIMASEKLDPVERHRYVSMMSDAFQSIASSLNPGGIQGVVFAHTAPDAWATLIEGLIDARLVPDASWPIDTETNSKFSAATQARLKTSVWLACRKRDDEVTAAFIGDVMDKMRPVIRERLLYFWSKGIRGADFFISAIGPALSVFGRYSKVLRPDGTEVSVRDFLDIVRKESTTVALQQVLGGTDLGAIDPVTRQYLTWVWSYSKAPLDGGEAIALCLATGASYDDTTRNGSIAGEGRERSKKVVRLRTIRQRAIGDEDLGYGTAARPAPLIDQLQYAAWLWGENLTDRLGAYRGGLGESRWTALRTLGQAVAECLPDGDEDRRIILGLLGSSVMGVAREIRATTRANGPMLPGFEAEVDNG